MQCFIYNCIIQRASRLTVSERHYVISNKVILLQCLNIEITTSVNCVGSLNCPLHFVFSQNKSQYCLTILLFELTSSLHCKNSLNFLLKASAVMKLSVLLWQFLHPCFESQYQLHDFSEHAWPQNYYNRLMTGIPL